MLFLYWKVIQSIFWVIKNERFVGMGKKVIQGFTCNIKSYSSNFSYGKKVILGLKIIPALFVAILYKVKKKLFSNFWVESRKKKSKKLLSSQNYNFFSKIIHEIVKIIIFFWHRWWQILGARIGAKMVIFG